MKICSCLPVPLFRGLLRSFGLTLLLTCFFPPTGFAGLQEVSQTAAAEFRKGLNARKLSEKIRYFSRAVEEQPNYDDAIYNLGICYFRTGDFTRSIDLLSRFSGPASSYYKDARLYLRNALTFRAEELVEAEQFEKALVDARQALYLDEDYPPGLTTLGAVYFHLGDHQAAIESLKKSVALEPSQEKAWMLLADVSMRVEDYASAQEAYDRVLQLNPKSRKAQFHRKLAVKRNRPAIWLGKAEQALADHDLDMAVELLQRGLTFHPGNSEMADLLRRTQDERDYELAGRALDRGEWSVAAELLAGITPGYAETDSLSALAQANLAPDSAGVSVVEDSARMASLEAVAFEPEMAAHAAPAATRDLLPEDTNRVAGELEGRLASNDQADSLVESAIADPAQPEPTNIEKASAPAADPAIVELENQLYPANASASNFWRRGLPWAALSSLALLAFVLFWQRRLRHAEAAAGNRAGVVIQVDENSAAAPPASNQGNPGKDGATFFDKIASETPVTFEPLLADETTSAAPGFDAPEAPGHTLSLQETRTIVGGAPRTERVGRYVIEKQIGRGSMGLIFKAWDPKLDRTVVIKQVALSGRGPGETTKLKDRLYREARAAGKLNHPNIVIIYDVEEENHFSYIVMEYLEGQNLREFMNENRLTPVRAVDVVGQVCLALDFAHRQGIVHRDIKPSNIMIRDTKVKVADFGIAKLPHSGTLTRTGDIVGTPFYMSPEQIEGRKIDGRSDIFSAGVLLYEMLTGQRPFDGDTIPAVVYKIVHLQPKAARQLVPALPDGADRLLARALAKEPVDRFSSADEFHEALRELRQELVEV